MKVEIRISLYEDASSPGPHLLILMNTVYIPIPTHASGPQKPKIQMGKWGRWRRGEGGRRKKEKVQQARHLYEANRSHFRFLRGQVDTKGNALKCMNVQLGVWGAHSHSLFVYTFFLLFWIFSPFPSHEGGGWASRVISSPRVLSPLLSLSPLFPPPFFTPSAYVVHHFP